MNSGAQRVCNEIAKEVRKKTGQDDVTIIVVQLHAPGGGSSP